MNAAEAPYEHVACAYFVYKLFADKLRWKTGYMR